MLGGVDKYITTYRWCENRMTLSHMVWELKEQINTLSSAWEREESAFKAEGTIISKRHTGKILQSN